MDPRPPQEEEPLTPQMAYSIAAIICTIIVCATVLIALAIIF